VEELLKPLKLETQATNVVVFEHLVDNYAFEEALTTLNQFDLL
jgi:hypothetical protein